MIKEYVNIAQIRCFDKGIGWNVQRFCNQKEKYSNWSHHQLCDVTISEGQPLSSSMYCNINISFSQYYVQCSFLSSALENRQIREEISTASVLKLGSASWHHKFYWFNGDIVGFNIDNKTLLKMYAVKSILFWIWHQIEAEPGLELIPVTVYHRLITLKQGYPSTIYYDGVTNWRYFSGSSSSEANFTKCRIFAGKKAYYRIY